MTIVGIDLGTTNSCVAILRNKNVYIIEDETRARVIPSVVTFADEGEILVGTSAKQIAHVYPKSTIYGIKRLMGQTYFDSKVQKTIKNYHFDVVNDRTTPKVQITNNLEKINISPEDVSAKILAKLKAMAEEYLEQPVHEAVVTVPAYFSGPQRSATISAAKLAGFHVVHIINEPTAAALAFQYNNIKKFERNVLVYDFGGGTFDVSIVAVVGKHCRVIGTHGDCYLGGTDVDRNLERYILEKIKEETGFVIDDVKRLKRISAACEDAKKLLSTTTEYEMELLNMTPNNQYFNIKITRQKFDEINEETFQKTIDIVNECLSEAQMTISDIDEIVLIGGSSRIPKVQEMIKKTFSIADLNKTINPDEAVAFGAAVYAASIQSDKAELLDEPEIINKADKADMTFEDVLSLSLGIFNKGGVMSTIIKRNSPLPIRGSETYSTVMHFQKEMLIEVYQGESLVATRNQFLGKFVISDIKSAARGETKVIVTFDFDAEGVLTVTASERDAENVKELVINLDSLSEEEVMRRLEQSEMTKEDEVNFVKFARKLNDLEYFCEDIKFAGGNLKFGLEQKLDEVVSRAKSLKLDEILVLDELKQEIREFITNAL